VREWPAAGCGSDRLLHVAVSGGWKS